MSHEVPRVNHESIAAYMTCPICEKELCDATTIIECSHTFCGKCLYKKLSDEEMKYCPVCNTDLGPSLLDKLRVDHNSQEVRGNMSYKSKTLKAREGVFTPLSLSPRKGESSSACNPMDYLVAAANQILTTTETKSSNATSTKKNFEIWFTLVASDDQNAGGPPLPQIPKTYMNIKDGSVPVSYIQKLLKSKLGLNSENEVDILCKGQRVPPSMSLNNLLAQWLQTTSKKRITTKVGKSAQAYVMTLGYARKVICD